MARFSAPGHPDCHVDCPAGGFAIYVKPHGPCETGCDSSEEVLKRIIQQDNNVIFSYKIRISGRRRINDFCLSLLRLQLSPEDALILGQVLTRIPQLQSRHFSSVIFEQDTGGISALVREIDRKLRPDDDPDGKANDNNGPSSPESSADLGGLLGAALRLT